jgi:phenylacetate-CoA ligase
MIKKVQDIINNSLYLSSTQLAPPVFQKIVDRINKYDPKFIRCYPVPLQFLAKQMKLARSNYNYKSLIAINTTGSTLHDNARIEIENVFNVKIFDSYSCEGGTSFDECYTHECYHASEEYAISEFIKDTFTITNSEQPLRHITTDLHNYASPFIRYDTQDYVVMGNNHGKCSCKKDLLSIKKIKGRDSDILITPSGKYLIVENFVAYFEWIPEVDQIQVVQDKLDEIVIKLIVNETFTPEVKMKIYNFWTNYIGSDVNLTLEVVDEIKLTPTGKRRTIIRNPNISLNG